AGVTLRRPGVHLTDLHGDSSTTPSRILPHRPILLSQRLLIIGRNAGTSDQGLALTLHHGISSWSPAATTSARWCGESHELASATVEVAFRPPTPRATLEHMSVMEQAVQHGGNRRHVAQHFSPVFHRTVPKSTRYLRALSSA